MRIVRDFETPQTPNSLRAAMRLASESTQEVENVLLLRLRERIEISDNGIGFGVAGEALQGEAVLAVRTAARMRSDRLQKVSRSTVMQEENALTQSPQGCRTKPIGFG